jgi:hypothetical protein
MKANRLAWASAIAILAAPAAASAQEVVGLGPSTEAVQPAKPAAEPRFALYYDASTGTIVKPVLGMAGGYNFEKQKNTYPGQEYKLDSLSTTVAVIAFGLEGKVGKFADFHSEFRRDPGLYGTSVWEGTISLTAMDNYVRVHHTMYGLTGSVAAGIVTDPASADYYSAHVADMFLADNYTRTTLLHSGFNRGQGIVASLNWKWFTIGFAASAGNPLATSTSYGFGGKVSAIGGLVQYPARAISSGNPQGGMELVVLSPSISFEHPYVDVKVAWQNYRVAVDTESHNDVPLRGNLFRGSVRGKIPVLGTLIVPFFNLARRTNDMILQASSGSPDPTQKDPDDYEATIVSGGLDWNIHGLSGIGGSYGWLTTKTGQNAKARQQFLNIGASWWFTSITSVGIRYARWMTSTEEMTTPTDPAVKPVPNGKFTFADGLKDHDAFFITLRMVL